MTMVTGTPLYHDEYDLVALVNLVASAPDDRLPFDPRMLDEEVGTVPLRLQFEKTAGVAYSSVALNQIVDNAKIALGVAGSQISVDQGDIDDGSTYATRLDAGADGRFSIPAQSPFCLSCPMIESV